MFLTLSADDLKEIGLDKFGPRRKMTNAIESWHKETAMISGADSGVDTSSISSHVDKLQMELQEKNRQLNQVCSSHYPCLLTVSHPLIVLHAYCISSYHSLRASI